MFERWMTECRHTCLTGTIFVNSESNDIPTNDRRRRELCGWFEGWMDGDFLAFSSFIKLKAVTKITSEVVYKLSFKNYDQFLFSKLIN